MRVRPANTWLAIYLNDHLAGATAGVELFHRGTSSQSDAARRTALSYLASEASNDRDTLIEMMGRLEVKVARSRVAVGWVAERLGRLKLNGALVRRSPLSDLVELEAMWLGAEGKVCLWRSLRIVAATDDRLDGAELDALEQRASSQSSELEAMRQSAAEALRS